MPEDQLQKIRQMLMEFDTAMLLTHGEGHQHHVRPMAIACVAPNCDLWFFTGRGANKTREIENDQQVLIICQNGRGRYLSLTGTARLVEDRIKAHEYWDEGFRTWFPNGPEDPDLMLISVAAKSVEYWDSHGTEGIKYIMEAAKAYAHGHRPHVEQEEHATVLLK